MYQAKEVVVSNPEPDAENHIDVNKNESTEI